MNKSVRSSMPCMVLLLAACATPRIDVLTESDINDPAPAGCKVNVHIDPRGKFAYIDQEPVITSLCSDRTVRFQVNGGYKFSGTGIALKSGGVGAAPACSFDPAQSRKKISCKFASAPADPSRPDRVPYEVKVERNNGSGPLTLDPMMIND